MKAAIRLLAVAVVSVAYGLVLVGLVLSITHRRDLAACHRGNIRTNESNIRAPEHVTDARDLEAIARRLGATAIAGRQRRLEFRLIPLTDCQATYRLLTFGQGATVYLRDAAGRLVYRLPR
jgi:hypothetical protein